MIELLHSLFPQTLFFSAIAVKTVFLNKLIPVSFFFVFSQANINLFISQILG